MVKRIIAFTFIPLLIVAFLLAIGGVKHIGLDSTYYNFINKVVYTAHDWELSIPNIPKIPEITNPNVWEVVNILRVFVNGISTALNVVINVLNTLIHVLQFILTFIFVCAQEIENIISLA